MDDDDQRPFSHDINKRPNKKNKNKLNLNKHTGISKDVIPANQLKNPTWDPVSRQWIEGVPPEYKKEPKYQFPATTEITGRVKDDFLLSRRVSNSRITPWRKVYVGPPDQSQPYWKQSRQPSHSRQSRQPIHSRQLGEGGRRSTHKHKRKNKHTRRRRVQRRRA